MRPLILALVAAAAGVAHADASLPGMRSEPRWVVACEARLQSARDDAAKIVPIFRAAHVWGADLYLDENILGSDVPVLFEAGVLPTREPALVAYRLERWATRAQIRRVMNDVFEPAIADCVRQARAAGD